MEKQKRLPAASILFLIYGVLSFAFFIWAATDIEIFGFDLTMVLMLQSIVYIFMAIRLPQPNKIAAAVFAFLSTVCLVFSNLRYVIIMFNHFGMPAFSDIYFDLHLLELFMCIAASVLFGLLLIGFNNCDSSPLSCALYKIRSLPAIFMFSVCGIQLILMIINGIMYRFDWDIDSYYVFDWLFFVIDFLIPVGMLLGSLWLYRGKVPVSGNTAQSEYQPVQYVQPDAQYTVPVQQNLYVPAAQPNTDYYNQPAAQAAPIQYVQPASQYTVPAQQPVYVPAAQPNTDYYTQPAPVQYVQPAAPVDTGVISETDTHTKSETQISAADEIMKFKNLLDMGVITQEQFEAKKNQLLGL